MGMTKPDVLHPRRHPEAPRFHQRGEGSRVELGGLSAAFDSLSRLHEREGHDFSRADKSTTTCTGFSR